MHYDFPSDADEEDDHAQATPLYTYSHLKMGAMEEKCGANVEQLVQSDI